MTPVLKIRDLVSENKVAEAIASMYTLSDIEDLSDDLVLISSQHHALKEKIRLQIIDTERQHIEANRIKARLLELLNDYENVIKVPIEGKNGHRSEATLLKELLRMLDLSWEAFKVQKRLTESLVDSVKERLHVRVNDIEKFFFTYFEQLAEDELRIHHMIRVYTERIMYPNNAQALEIIQQNSPAYHWHEKIPAMELLEEHLIFWKVKYEAVFVNTPSMCVVYLLLSEGKGFPIGGEDEIEEYMYTLSGN